MKLSKLSLIIASVFLFFSFFAKPVNVHAQNFYCIWDDSVGGQECLLDNASECTAAGCTYNCGQFISWDTCYNQNPHPCNCPTHEGALDLNSLYGAIQTKGGAFNFADGVTVGEIISAFLIIVFPLVGLILLLIIIANGFKMMTSAGDPKKIASARDGLTTGIIGFIIIFTAFWIVQIVGKVLRLPDLWVIF